MSSDLPLSVTGTTLQSIDTLANLRAANANSFPDLFVIVLDGYGAANDGGGGLFVWRATSTAADDGGTIIRPTNVPSGSPGRWVRLYSGAINVRWFGAGLGGADDAPVIQRAIETAIHGGSYGSTVYLPAGNYNIQQPIYIETSDASYNGWIAVRVSGDGKFNTHILMAGAYSTAFVFGGLSQTSNPGGAATRIRHSEISDLSIEQVGTPTRLDGAIQFLGGGIGFLIRDVTMYGVWRGITCNGTPTSYTWRAKIQNVHMEGVVNAGIYARFAVNWDVSQTYIGGANHLLETAGIWLDTRTEGWMFTVLETGGFDTGLRMTNRSPFPPNDVRPPDTHQFIQCNFDDGGRACIWLTNSHRCRFQGCYASSVEATLTGVIVIDGADVYGFEWTGSVILNAFNYGFWISDATSFSITDSTFATWGTTGAIGTYDAITIAGATTAGSAHMSFVISGNTFTNDSDFPANPANALRPIRVQGSPFMYFQKYIVTNNISYGAGMVSATNNGIAVTGHSVFTNNF